MAGVALPVLAERVEVRAAQQHFTTEVVDDAPVVRGQQRAQLLLGGAAVGAVVGGKKGAKKGAAIGAVTAGTARGVQRGVTYDALYRDCMRGSLYY